MFFSSRPEPKLHQAVLQNQPDCVQQQLEQGASLEEANAYGLTALDLARLLDRSDCLTILDPNRPQPKIPIVLPGSHVRKVYSPQDLEKNLGLHYLSYPKFKDYATLKRAMAHLPYFLTHGSTGDYCAEIAMRYQEAIAQGHSANVTAVWVNEEIGFGLITNRHLEAGSFVGLYTGLVRPLDWWGAKANAWCMRYPQRFFSSRHLILDASLEANLMRFANHSETPNLTPYCAIVKRVAYFLFLTNQFVPRGSFLTFDYGPDFWKWRVNQT